MYYVYIATNKNYTVLYTGVTNNIFRRMDEHKNVFVSGFTKKYNVCKLVYCEVYEYVNDAIAVEKTIKGWRRSKKIALIRNQNPWLKNLLENNSKVFL